MCSRFPTHSTDVTSHATRKSDSPPRPLRVLHLRLPRSTKPGRVFASPALPAFRTPHLDIRTPALRFLRFRCRKPAALGPSISSSSQLERHVHRSSANNPACCKPVRPRRRLHMTRHPMRRRPHTRANSATPQRIWETPLRLQNCCPAAERAAARPNLRAVTTSPYSHVIADAAHHSHCMPYTSGHLPDQNPDALALRRRSQLPKRQVLASGLPLCAAPAFGAGNLRPQARAQLPARAQSGSPRSAAQTTAALPAVPRRPRRRQDHHANR